MSHMHKSDVIAHFGSQQKTADALTAAGFPISQRGVSGWSDPIPLDWATVVEKLTGRKFKVDISVYRQPAQ